MKFELLEAAKKQVKAHESMCAQNDKKRAAALKEINKAKKTLDDVITNQIENGEESMDDVIKAQAAVSLAEAKYKRLLEQIGEENEEFELRDYSPHAIKMELRRYQDTGLYDDMKEELAELQQAKDQYLAAVEKAAVKFYQIKQEYSEHIREAEKLAGEHPRGEVPITFSPTLLRSYGMWWNPNDAYEDMYPIKTRAMETVEGITQRIKGITIPDKMIIEEKRNLGWEDENGVIWTNKKAE